MSVSCRDCADESEWRDGVLWCPRLGEPCETPPRRHLTPDEQTKMHDALMASATAVEPPRPRWRPHTEPVPQDDAERLVLCEMGDGSIQVRSAAGAARAQEIDVLARWCWWDEVDAMLGGGA
jgi:hypothetical protein